MEDLALSLDRQNAEDLMRIPVLAAPGYQLEQSMEGTESHAPLPVQSPDADKPSSPIEASQQDPGISDSSRLSLEDTIRKYIPDKSDLATSLEQRNTFACLVGDGIERTTEERSDHNKINDFLVQAETPGRPSLLVVQDANIHWSKVLCARYPKSFSPELLAGHIIRFDKIPIIPSTYSKRDDIQSYLNTLYPDAEFTLYSSGNFMSINMNDRFHLANDEFNLDFIAGSYHGEASTHLRRVSHRPIKSSHNRLDVFERNEQNNWRRISVRLSCHRLALDFHLVLVDSTATPERIPREINWPVEEYTPRIIQIQSPLSGELRLPSGPVHQKLAIYKTDAVLGQVIALVQSAFEGYGHTLQAVFDPQVLPCKVYRDFRRRSWGRARIFLWLLTETSWRCFVADLESRLRESLWESTSIAGGGHAFDRLTDLRRRLPGAYESLAEAQELVELQLKSRLLSWDVGDKIFSAEAFWSEERARPKAVGGVFGARSIDIRDVPTTLEDLLRRLQTVIHTVNEEIPMVIGSAQVEDARVMRRQTEWTVVLAVLATIYLPMTLVTGLFGMNITEIDAGATAPDRWSVVRAWGVVFGATMGSIFVYAAVKYILRCRRIVRMLLGKKMREIGGGSLYRRLLAFKDRVRGLWLYRNIRQFRKKMREWDEEAQKMDKLE